MLKRMRSLLFPGNIKCVSFLLRAKLSKTLTYQVSVQVV